MKILLNKKMKNKAMANNFSGIYINLAILVMVYLGTILPNHTIFLVILILLKTAIYLFSYIYLRYKIDY